MWIRIVRWWTEANDFSRTIITSYRQRGQCRRSVVLPCFFSARRVERAGKQRASLIAGASFASSSEMISSRHSRVVFWSSRPRSSFQVAKFRSREARRETEENEQEVLALSLSLSLYYKLRATRPTSGVLIELQANHYLEFHRLISKICLLSASLSNFLLLWLLESRARAEQTLEQTLLETKDTGSAHEINRIARWRTFSRSRLNSTFCKSGCSSTNLFSPSSRCNENKILIDKFIIPRWKFFIVCMFLTLEQTLT